MGRATGQSDRADERSATPRRRRGAIKSADIAALLELANEMHDLPNDLAIRERHMLLALRRVLAAGRAASALVKRHAQGISSIKLTVSGADDSAERWRPHDPTWTRLARLAGPAGDAFVRADSERGELISVMRVPESPRSGPRGGPLMLEIDRKRNRAMTGRATRRSSPALVSVLRFARADGRPFCQREHELLRLFHSQADWIFRRG